MQIIKTTEYKEYFCPMKFSRDYPLTYATCNGPRCMWWTYKREADFSVFPAPPSISTDITEGYCGK